MPVSAACASAAATAALRSAPISVTTAPWRRDASELAADLGTGAVEIIAPPNTNLVLDYSVSNGMLLDNDQTLVSGENLNGTSPLGRSVDNEPTLTIDIEVNQGIVAVKR